MIDRPSYRDHGTSSFRDPGGVLVLVRGTPIRCVRAGTSDVLWSFLSSDVAKRWVDRRALVTTERLSGDDVAALAERAEFHALVSREPWAAVVRHEPIPFRSFPEEWTPGMLWAAAELTLSLAEELLEDGRGLKDATPFNVLFRGPQPVFVDLLSIEERNPTDPVWLPYAQFLRTFLLPLLVHRAMGHPVRSSYVSGQEGIEPRDALRMLSVRNRLRFPALTAVTLPVLLGRLARHRAAAPFRPRQMEREKAAYVLRALFRSIRRDLKRVQPHAQPASEWTEYADVAHPADYFEAKRRLAGEVAHTIHLGTALDVGCNTGDLSVVMANAGCSVVAIDSDVQVVEHLWSRARKERLDILPLVVDIADPTPARGWVNRERPSFLDRAAGQFDVVIGMAVVHHLLVTAGVPLDRILGLFADLSRNVVLLEFVPPADPHFQRLARGRDALYSGLTRSAFELALEERFRVTRAVELPVAGRVAYVLETR